MLKSIQLSYCSLLVSLIFRQTEISGMITNQVVDKDSMANFQVHVIDKSDPIDSVVVSYKKSYMFNTFDRYSLNIVLKPNHSGNFQFSLPITSGAGKITQLQIFTGKEYLISKEYLIETEDRINLTICKKGDQLTLNFSGKGSDKYTCRRNIELTYDKLREGYFRYNANTRMTDFKFMDSISNAWKLETTKIINQNKKRIGILAYQVMQADAQNQVPLRREQFYRIAFNKSKKPEEREKIRQHYLSSPQKPITFSDQTYTLSYQYLQDLIRQVQTYLYLSHNGSQYSIAEVYKYIDVKYQGVLKERLLMQLLINPMFGGIEMEEHTEDYENCLQKALLISKSTQVRYEISKKLSSIKKGLNVYNFSLLDQNGNFVRLEDFRGKVILLDIWFTGCTACKQFSEKMQKEITPVLKENDSFVVVSISTDKNKAVWLKSLSQNTYTTNDHINLYTNGLGADHPLLLYYEARSFPFLLLIDKDGKLFSRFNASINAKDLIKLVQSAIASD
ncbi:hypothetical protein DBR43_09810 [Pedobacter sp. KBW06]|uniref:TlpA family protein disulfide reductase n=1 Tax=Pedobacter sp. KBW06 TaxID=2153359 RepID=UPI000F59A5E6|nr:TlpA disulfide reductase family protein [Pedobacter sp. KBW06]RQO75623.1 hypothetical protein DBR43_09810 [Pedobacter sp. KBW06]